MLAKKTASIVTRRVSEIYRIRRVRAAMGSGLAVGALSVARGLSRQGLWWVRWTVSLGLGGKRATKATRYGNIGARDLALWLCSCWAAVPSSVRISARRWPSGAWHRF